MFIGHFAVAFLLLWVFQDVNALVLYLGVSYPDLLWGVLVPLRVEEARVPKDSPLIRDMEFTSYPYSHSLVLTTMIALAPAIAIAALTTRFTAALFVAASISHWLLDAVVHHRDLPVLGFGEDRYVGLGLWNYPVPVYVGEYLLYAAAALLFLPQSSWLPALAIGAAFHLLNANAFLGLTDENQITDARVFGVIALVGFLGLSLTLYAFV